jgi:histidine triad (HIT) family protein
VADSSEAPTNAVLTDAEWAVLDAIRFASDISTAAEAVGQEAPDFRRALSLAGEKLRMSSALATVSSSHTAGGFQVPYMAPCPYCENFAGRFSERSGRPAVIYQDDLVYVFLAPAALGGMPGHSLVTTRRHAETIFDLSQEEASTVGATVARTARMLRAALDPEGLLIQRNNGAAAFQTVPHVHLHVIPKVAGPFPPVEQPRLIPPVERAALAADLRRHW